MADIAGAGAAHAELGAAAGGSLSAETGPENAKADRVLSGSDWSDAAGIWSGSGAGAGAVHAELGAAAGGSLSAEAGPENAKADRVLSGSDWSDAAGIWSGSGAGAGAAHAELGAAAGGSLSAEAGPENAGPESAAGDKTAASSVFAAPAGDPAVAAWMASAAAEAKTPAPEPGQESLAGQPASGTEDEADEEEDEGNIIDKDVPLSLSDHLEELRRRLFVCAGCWMAVSCLAYTQAEKILEYLRVMAGGTSFKFVYTSPTEAFMSFIKLSLIVGAAACVPVFLYQAAAFINPGLRRRERRLLFSLVPVSFGLFCLGGLFAWYVALPIMWRFFLSFSTANIEALWTIGEVVGFASGLITACGIVFELPIFVIGLARLGIISYEKLSGSRRIIYFSLLAASAIITPTPDAFTCVVVAMPLILLFELSLWVIRIGGGQKKDAAAPASDGN